MAKKEPSAETQLRRVRRELKEAIRERGAFGMQAASAEIRASRLEKDRDEWKRRFDRLLERTPKQEAP